MRLHSFVLGALLLWAAAANATIYGSVHGLIHDPQHRPVEGAAVTLRAESSEWAKTVASDARGEFRFDAVPLGGYRVSVTAEGFAAQSEALLLQSQRDAEMHFSLQIAKTQASVEVAESAAEVNTESATAATVISRADMQRTPGADQTNSLAMITNYVPGAYMVHDQLHVRGGHQVSWLLDGVPVPNTNIASNVGPQFDPKDMDYLEVQRGGFSAEYGDRAYGVFNVVTRSGFERNREGEFVGSYGNFNTTNDQLSLGSHTQNLAWYGSLSGYRSDLGLETPVPEVIHDQTAGLSGFGSVIYNRTPEDQLRFLGSVRGDHYRIPNTQEQQGCVTDCARDVEDERDTFVNFSWLHTAAPGVLFTVSPFFHFNRANYIGGAADPIQALDDRGSSYAGGVVQAAITRGKHNAHFGIQGFAQHDNQFFSLLQSSSASNATERDVVWGSLASLYAEDQYKVLPWLTLDGGVRLTRFSGGKVENIADPRVGAAIRVPKLSWVLRGFFGRYYQAPPLLSITGPLLAEAVSSGVGFLPLNGERDQQINYGLTVPLRGWVLDVDYFRTNAKNFFDHDALLNSNIFIPLTIQNARIKGTEVTLRGPQVAHRFSVHAAWSHQFAQGRGGVTGGLTDFSPPPDNNYFFLDHDQRDTVSFGVDGRLPWRSWAAANVAVGTGFLNGDGMTAPTHMGAHATLDLSCGKTVGENWSLGVTATNLGNGRYQLDNSNTFGGTHWNYGRQVYAQVKYRFRF
jgi:outer membrane receptor for ferrienterochelin and colicin